MKVVLIIAILVIASQVQAGTSSFLIKQGKTTARSVKKAPLKAVPDLTTINSLKGIKLEMEEKAKAGAILVRHVVKSAEHINGGEAKFSIALVRERIGPKAEVKKALNLYHHKLSEGSQKKISEILERYNIRRGGSQSDLTNGTDRKSFGMWALELNEQDFNEGLANLNQAINDIYRVAASDEPVTLGRTVKTRSNLGNTEK